MARFQRTRRAARVVSRRRGGRFRTRGPMAGKGTGFLPALIVSLLAPTARQMLGPMGTTAALAAGGWWGGSDTLMTLAGLSAGQQLAAGGLNLGGLLGGGGGAGISPGGTMTLQGVGFL